MANPEAPRSPDGASPSNPLITRRRVLGGMAGVAGLAAVPSLIAAGEHRARSQQRRRIFGPGAIDGGGRIQRPRSEPRW